MSKKAKRILVAILIVIVATCSAGGWYVSDYQHADPSAYVALSSPKEASDGVRVEQLSQNAIAFVPETIDSGFIFYPGAKVEPEAYAPLMRRCAGEGVLCVLVKPRFNLAIIDVDVANGIVEQYPQVGKWMIGGHSMGGVAASTYASNHMSDFDCVVFLASYPTADLCQFEGKVLLVAGTNDGVLNRKRYEESSKDLPSDAKRVEIQGGNHAYFGNYGEQEGDGTASITRDEQQAQTTRAITELM